MAPSAFWEGWCWRRFVSKGALPTFQTQEAFKLNHLMNWAVGRGESKAERQLYFSFYVFLNFVTWTFMTWSKTDIEIDLTRVFPSGSEVKVPPFNAGDLGSIPGSGRSPGEGNGNPLQYSCLENPMDGEAW